MININPTDPLTLDRENLEAIDQSTRQQWSSLRYLLGLPDLQALNGEEQRVANEIARRIYDSRGRVGSVPEIQQQLITHFRAEQSISRESVARPSVGNGARGENIALADAWLKTIFSHFGESDIRELSRHLSSGILLTSRTSTWVDGATSIDLNHGVWQNGTVEQIRQRLINQHAQDVGITSIHTHPLTAADVDQILNTSCSVVIDSNPAAPRSRNLTLRDALNRRVPIQNLLATTTDSRELMLALATILRDPTASDVLNAGSAELTRTRNELVANGIRMNAVQGLQVLKEGIPQQTEAEINHGINAMGIIIQNLGVGSGLNTGESINLYTGVVAQRAGSQLGSPLNPDEERQAIRARMPNAITRLMVQDTRGQVQRDNSDQFTRIAEQAQTAMEKLEQELLKVEKIENALNGMAALLQAQEITAAQLSVADFPALNRCMNFGTTPYQANRGVIGPGMNVGQIEQEFRRALLQANPTRSLALESFEAYDAKSRELSKKLEDLTNNPNTLTGPDACWQIIARGLEHQGIRGKELENTLQYMRAQVQRTPESIRDRRSLAEAEFSYDGDENKIAKKQYNEGKGYFGFPRILFPATNPYKSYKNRIFTQQNIGLTLRDNPFERRFPLPRLLDAYCRTKYLMGLPTSDPRSLPHSQEIVTFMRRLHEAILERSQESFNYASGMSNAEIMELRAKSMDIDAARLRAMTPTERMQFVQDYLHNPQAYIERNKTTIEKIADRAYRPIKKDLEGHQRHWNDVKSLTKGTGKVLWYATGAFAVAPVAKFATNKVVKPLWNNKGSMALGAVAGTFFMPVVGTAIGAAVGPWIKRKFFATK